MLAAFTQPDVVRAFVDEPDQNYLRTSIEAVYAAMATGFVSSSGNEAIDSLFSRGGMSSMLTTVWLILGALSFAAVMEQAGFLDRLIRPVVARARSATQLILTVAATAIVRGWTLVTRNVRDVADTGVTCLDPFLLAT